MRHLILLSLALCATILSYAQDDDTLSFPEVGKPMPDLVIKNIAYFPKKKAYIHDFRGRWLILDFWSVNCGACVAAFPRMNRIQQTFGKQVQVLLVGLQDPERKIQPLFAKYREREHLSFPCAFDSSIFDRLDLFLVPHTIIIDDKGIVRSVVVAIDTTEVRQFLDGKNPQLKQTYRRMKDTQNEAAKPADTRIPFNMTKPMLVNGNGDLDSAFLFRSLLSRWVNGKHFFYMPDNFDAAAITGKFQLMGGALQLLYNYAYLGKGPFDSPDSASNGLYFDRMIIEATDATLFDYSKTFNYSLIRPAAGNTVMAMRTAMQHDLENYFGLSATVETRKLPCWKLIAKSGSAEKLRSKGGQPYSDEISRYVGWKVTNRSMWYLLDGIRVHDPGRDKQTETYIDETGITGPIDITLDCIMSDLADLRKALAPYGLDLERGEKEMKVLIIRDGEKK